MKQIKLAYVIWASLIFTACSKTSNECVEYIPFQESENELWGMIAPNGEVLFSEEFEETPTTGDFSFEQTMEHGKCTQPRKSPNL